MAKVSFDANSKLLSLQYDRRNQDCKVLTSPMLEGLMLKTAPRDCGVGPYRARYHIDWAFAGQCEESAEVKVRNC